MVMMAEPIVKAFRSLPDEERGEVFVLSARGAPFTQETADRWSRLSAITLICGRYKGVDERVLDILDATEVSLGDFVIPGGELAAAAMVEATARLLPGVLGDADSGAEDSHRESLLGYPDYTRPEVFEGRRVPEVLLSGHHARIAQWRRNRRLETTWRRRPELLTDSVLSDDDREFLDSLDQGRGHRTEPGRDAGRQRKE